MWKSASEASLVWSRRFFAGVRHQRARQEGCQRGPTERAQHSSPPLDEPFLNGAIDAKASLLDGWSCCALSTVARPFAASSPENVRGGGRRQASACWRSAGIPSSRLIPQSQANPVLATSAMGGIVKMIAKNTTRQEGTLFPRSLLTSLHVSSLSPQFHLPQAPTRARLGPASDAAHADTRTRSSNQPAYLTVADQSIAFNFRRGGRFPAHYRRRPPPFCGSTAPA